MFNKNKNTGSLDTLSFAAENSESSHRRQITVNALANTAMIIAVHVGGGEAVSAAKDVAQNVADHFDPAANVEFGDKQEHMINEGDTERSMIIDNVDYDANEVTTETIQHEAAQYPENAETFKDGVFEVGETYVIPDSAYKRK